MYAPSCCCRWRSRCSYSTLRWNGIGPWEFVGLDNYVKTLTDPDLFGTIINAFKLIVLLQLHPGGARAGRRRAHPSRRDRAPSARPRGPSLFLPQVIPLVAAGIIWSWLLSKNGLINQILTAIGLGDVTRAWLADFDWPCRRSASSESGSCWACAPSCC